MRIYKKKKSNSFYIIYNADLYELPAGYFDTLDELAAYFEKSKTTISSIVSKMAKGKYGHILRHGKPYTIQKYTDIEA